MEADRARKKIARRGGKREGTCVVQKLPLKPQVLKTQESRAEKILQLQLTTCLLRSLGISSYDEATTAKTRCCKSYNRSSSSVGGS